MASKPKPISLQPRFRIQRGSDVALGPGKVELLELVGTTGSITEAARRMGMSYNRAWLLIQTMNTCFQSPVVKAIRGGKTHGGAQLTATGHQAVTLYRNLETQSHKATVKMWSQLRALLQS